MAHALNLFQIQELKDLLGDDFVPLIKTFMVEAEARLQAIAHAHTGGDNTTGCEAVHALQGACANLGAVVLAGLCGQLQAACRDESIADQAALVKEIQTEYRRVLAALRPWLAG